MSDLTTATEQVTKQQLFDTVVAHLRAQGCRSLVEVCRYGYAENSCLYRGPNGTKCGFGVCITDAEYTPAMEGQRAAQVISVFNLARYWDVRLFANELPKIHDYSDVESWESVFRILAGDHGLTYTPPVAQ